MGLKPRNENAARERVLLMGAAGAGKSNAVMSIAANVDNRVHVIDTELDVYDRLNEEEGLENLVVHGVLPDDWAHVQEVVKGLVDEVERDDWVVVDSMSPTWPAVQDWFTQEIMGQDMAGYFMAVRKETSGRSLQAFDGWVDWQVINAQYNQFYNNLLRCTSRGAHLLMTAEVDRMGDDESRETRAMFGKIGLKPRGQKRLPHIPHSTLWMRQLSGSWEMETVKEQGKHRDEINVEVVDFGKQYLMGVAKWEN